MKSAPSREARILCRCSLVDPDSWSETDAQLLGPGVDWQGLVRGAYQHSVVPLLHRYLRFHDSILADFPAECREEIHKSSQSCLIWNMHLRLQLAMLLAQFQGAAIDMIVLKGIPMTELLYGDLSLRRCFDIDLLVRKEDFRKADHRLLAGETGQACLARFGGCRRRRSHRVPRIQQWGRKELPGGQFPGSRLPASLR